MSKTTIRAWGAALCLGGLALGAAADSGPAAAEPWPAKRVRKSEKTGPVGRGELVRLGRRLQERMAAAGRAKAVPGRVPSALGVWLRGGGAAPAAPAAAGSADWKIAWNERNGTPIFLDNPTPAPSAKAAAGAAPEELALDFLASHRALFRLRDPRDELKAQETVRDRLGRRHVKFQQQYRGIPLWGCEVVAHLEARGGLYALNGRYAPTPRGAPTEPAIDAAQAVRIAARHLEASTPVETLDEGLKTLLGYEGPEAAQYLWIDEQTQRVHLIWQVEIRPNGRQRWHYFVDALSGEILEYYNATQTQGALTAPATDLLGRTRTLNVFEQEGTFYLIDASRPIFQAVQPDVINNPLGALWTLDLRGADLNRRSALFQVSSTLNLWSDPVAVSAHANSGLVFDYFFKVHGRRGIDGQGGTMISLIHVAQNGRPMDNAFWNGAFIAYGDGDVAFKPLAGALDIAAHEMTHGVIERTVNLASRFQSGALNESLADVFAAMVDRDDWLIGEDAARRGVFPSGALRNMADPHNGGAPGDPFWQPANMDEFVRLDLTRDNGGVHINNGIPNHACFFLARAIGREKTEQIYFRVLQARYLNSQARFVDMRLAAGRAAADLFGADSGEVEAVAAAFDSVGIVELPPPPPPPSIQPIEGEEWIAVVNADPHDRSLFLVRPTIQSSDDVRRLTFTQVFTGSGRPISVAGDGSFILFVDADHFIRRIATDGSGEEVISSEGRWSSIALSPDGTRLAATTTSQDSTIFIIDLADPEAGKAIRLFSPTTQEGVQADIVRFADAMDWDSSGRFLVYDAYNSIAQPGKVSIDFWDVHLLEVDDEIILPLFPALPEGISMGNPSFASTSDNILVVDRFDANRNLNQIWGMDLFSGESRLIENNASSLGAPRYSPDDRALIFQRLEGGVPSLRRISLKENKIEADASSQRYVRAGQLPNWFAIGQRGGQTPTSVEEEEEARPSSFQLQQNFPNPFNPQTAIRYTLARPGQVLLSVYDLRGRRVAVLESGFREAGAHQVIWRGLDEDGRVVASGVYFYRLELGGERQLSRKMVLLR